MVDKEKIAEKESIAVVMELPTQPYNQIVTEEGEKVKMITLLQAVTEIYNDIKEIKVAVA